MSRILHLGRGMSGELVLKSVCALGAGRNPGPIFIPSAIVPATSPHRNRKQFGRTLSDESDSSQGFSTTVLWINYLIPIDDTLLVIFRSKERRF
jgi:hypothetical protein